MSVSQVAGTTHMAHVSKQCVEVEGRAFVRKYTQEGQKSGSAHTQEEGEHSERVVAEN